MAPSGENKRFLPAEFKGKKNLALNESLFGFSEKAAIVSYQGSKKKNVVVLSSMHDTIDIPKDDNPKTKPQMVLTYNKTKGGVDTMDQMAMNRTCKRQTKRRPMVLFFNMLDTSGLAAHVLFKNKHPGDKRASMQDRAGFLRSVGKELMAENMSRR